MFRLQSIFEQCPDGGALSYELSIPVKTSTRDFKASILLPEGGVEEAPLENGKISIRREDGAGLWRFDVRLQSANGDGVTYDSNIIDVIILEEASEEIRQEVEKSIAAIKINPGIYSHPSTIVAESLAKESKILHDKFGGGEIPEIIRRMCLDRKSNLWQTIVLLQSLITKPAARPYWSIIGAACSDILCGFPYGSRTTALTLLHQLMLKPAEKWLFYLRVLSEANDAQFRGDGSVIHDVVRQLVVNTPPSNKGITLQVCELICEQDPSKISAISDLFSKWGHKDGIPRILQWLETNPDLANSICQLLKVCNYREATPTLRSVLSLTTFDRGGSALMETLSGWKDKEAIDLILEKLELDVDKYHVGQLVEYLGRFADISLVERVKKIQAESQDEKAKAVEDGLKKWLFAQ
jgi:hypothetical protein